MEDIDPSIQGLSAEEVTLNRRMLTHPDVGISRAKADEIAADHDALTVFAQCCRYIEDHQQGDVRSPGALINRFDNPDKWPTPEITETPGSNFYYQFWQEVRNLGETDAANEPVTAHSNALSASDTNDKARIDPTPDDQPAQTLSKPGQLNLWNGDDKGSTNGANLWEKAKYELEQRMPTIAYQQYVQATEIIDYTTDTFIIGAPSKSARDFLNSRLAKTIPFRQAMSVLEKLTGQPVTLLFVDRNDPQDRPALAKQTTAAVGDSDDGQIDPAPNDSPQPEPEPNPLPEQLQSLLDQLNASEANAIIRAVNRESNQIRTQALPADKERDHIDQLFTHCINTLENEHPRITACTRGSRPAPSCGDSDTDQITSDDHRDDAPSPEPATHMQDENIEYRKVELNRHDHKPSTINFIPAQPVTCPPKAGPVNMLVLGHRKGGEMARKKHTPEQVINLSSELDSGWQ